MESFINMSRSDGDIGRSVANVSQHNNNFTTQMTPTKRTAPPSPKTIQIEMMEEEREEQQRGLEQIEGYYDETRLWWAHSCLRRAI